MMNWRLLMVMSAAVGVLGGCSIGKTKMVMVTRTNVGINAETTPVPLAEISMSRSEALIAPVYSGGETPAALAGASTKANTGIFEASIGSAFATGRAAAILADPKILRGTGLHGAGDLNVLIPLSELNAIKEEMQKIRPVYFATDTSTGLKASWTGTAGQYPDRVHLGYNRKEGALAPLTISPQLDDNGEQVTDNAGNALVTIHAPSLIATVTVDVQAKSGAKFDQVQFFASGRAAELLAPQEPIRASVFDVVKPDKTIDEAVIAEKSPCYDELTSWQRADGDAAERTKRQTEVESFLQNNGFDDVSLFEVLWLSNTDKRVAAQAAVCEEFGGRAPAPVPDPDPVPVR